MNGLQGPPCMAHNGRAYHPTPTRTMSFTEETVTPPLPRARTQTRAPGVTRLSRLRRRLSQANVVPFEVEFLDGTIERLVGGSYTGDDTDEPRFRIVLRNSKGLSALNELDELTLGIAFLDGDYDIKGDFLSPAWISARSSPTGIR